MAEYRFLVTDFSTGEVKAELPFTEFSFTRNFLGIGSASASIPMRHEKATRENLDPGRTAVFVLRNAKVVWGGLLWTAQISGNLEDPDLKLGFSDFLSYWQHRYAPDAAYYNTPDTDIMSKMMRAPGPLPESAQNYLGGNTIPFAWSGVKVLANGKRRDRRYYANQTKTVYDLISELALCEGGSYYRLKFSQPSPSGMTILPYIELSQNAGVYHSNIVFELNGANTQSLSYSEDATRMVPYSVAIGSSDTNLRSVYNRTRGLEYGLYENITKYSDISQPETLDDKALGEVKAKGQPVALVSNLEAIVSDAINVGVYEMGDCVRVRARDGWLEYDSVCRVVSDTTTINENGDESLSITFSSWTEAVDDNGDTVVETEQVIKYSNPKFTI